MSRTGYGLNEVMNRIALRIELDKKTLLALLDMPGSCGVHEAEARRGVDNFDNTVDAYGIEQGGMCFHRNQLSRDESGDAVRDLHPS
jgi:hypothetical protein